ncbi:Legumin B [Linum perenne]
MASKSVLSFSLCLVLVLFHSCSGMSRVAEKRQEGYSQNECQFRNLNAREPDRRITSEAGVTEVWDENDDQFQCAGVAILRHIIEERGLLLPAYTNAPKLVYVDQGRRGYHGAAIPGCAETYQSVEESGSRQDPRQGVRDQHQKIRPIREGDVIALPAGVADWFYNDAQTPLVLVQLLDTSNPANQLDQNFRKFFLAGNPQQQVQGQRGEVSERGERQRSLSRRGSSRLQEGRSGNIFQGFDEQFLAESYNVDTDLARRMKNENDNRGIIVRVEERLQFLTPEFSEEEREYQGGRGSGGRYSVNGIDETFCSAKLKQNLNDPSRADVFNPRAGRVTSVNSHNLPILRALRLSVQKVHLYRNAIMAPHWNINSHSVCYFTRGNGRVQIVDEEGNSVFDGEVREGQVLTAPQNFAVIKKAGGEGLEFVAFKTNDQAKINQLAGRLSSMRAFPEEVIANSFQVSREDARRLKFNREEVTLFSPGSQSQYRPY